MQAPPLSTTPARNWVPISPSRAIADGAGLAHDAGNLLGALGLYCDLLEMPGILRPEHLHYARELRLLSRRSGAMITRLLTAFAPPPPMPLQPLVPATVARRFTPLLRSIAAPDVELSMSVAKGLPPLPFAAEDLERILVNLTRNAATATRRHWKEASSRTRGKAPLPQIEIALTGNHGNLCLTVSDNGPGMGPAIVAAFLNQLQPGHLAPSGLGHRVVHDLVTCTLGRMSITTAPNIGTTIRVNWEASANNN